jgi:hypothetical protein
MILRDEEDENMQHIYIQRLHNKTYKALFERKGKRKREIGNVMGT